MKIRNVQEIIQLSPACAPGPAANCQSKNVALIVKERQREREKERGEIFSCRLKRDRENQEIEREQGRKEG